MLFLVKWMYTLGFCGRLWLFARLAGAPIPLRDLLRMRSQKIDVAEVVRSLMAVHQAGLAVTPEEIKQAYGEGVDVRTILQAMVEARKRGMPVSFSELVEAATTRPSG